MNSETIDPRAAPTSAAVLSPPGCSGPSLDSNEAPPSFDQIYRDGFPFVFRVLRSLGVRPERLEDAAQDVFTIVHRRLSDFEGRSTVRTWLFGIAQRVASDHRRTERRKASPLAPMPPELPTGEASPQARLEAQQVAVFLDGFVKTLSLEKRAVFALAFIEDMPANEVAEALGIPLNTAYSRIRTVRAELRKAMERRKLK